MQYGFFIVSALSLSTVAFALWLRWRMAKSEDLPLRRFLLVCAVGGIFSILATTIERWILSATGLELRAGVEGSGLALLAMMALVAPLEEALKVGAIWPLYASRRLVRGKVGALYAVGAAAGFAAVESFLYFAVWGHVEWIDLLRSAFSLPAHFFFAGVWGFTLGGVKRERYFGVTWLVCTLLHGLYDHVVFGRGAGFLVVVIPMLAMMAFGVFGLLRDRRGPRDRTTAYTLFESPSAETVRAVLSRKERPLMLHWIIGGAFVSVGVTLTSLAGAVYLGHRLDIDFALAEEPTLAGALPIALLGTALLASFPISAYLIAKASAAVSVLEPAWATGVALVAVLALFSVTEPTALVIALAVAPVGFALACAGAWFGIERSD